MSKPIYIFDFDDFSPKNTNFGLLEKLREHYPNFKVTLFTVPWETRFGDPTIITEHKFEPFCSALRKLDWMEIALHGLTHVPEEFLRVTYNEAKKRLLVGEKMFINRKIPYTRLFKAPYWQLSEEGKRAAEELGWTVMQDGYYNWNLKDAAPSKTIKKDGKEYIFAHGHIQDVSGNGLEESMWKIMQLPSDAEFGFLSDFMGTEKVDPETMDFRDPLERVKITVDGKELA